MILIVQNKSTLIKKHAKGRDDPQKIFKYSSNQQMLKFKHGVSILINDYVQFSFLEY